MDFITFMEMRRASGQYRSEDAEGVLFGARVRLMSGAELGEGFDDFPSEEGEVITHDPKNDMIVVQIPPNYGEGDDGLRECHVDQVKEVLTDA